MTSTTAPSASTGTAATVAPTAPSAAAASAAPAIPADCVSLTINGQRVVAKKGTLLVEAAKQVEIDIPVFCYHEKLKPVGACRMCLVEIEKMPRLQTACTTPVAEGMVVKTQSELAKHGQSSTVALLLANHPLDCPVCDKGGECPLQDNTFGFGPGQSKFEEEKRHKDKAFELSENIVLDRERCILCYRCVRFHEEIPGDRALAVLDRGGYGQIGVLDGERYESPFQGNTIDICPVGALTSRHYRFRSRPWDLEATKSIACDDPTGANIFVDTRDGRVLRIRPRENGDVNDVWIADRTRFASVPKERATRLGSALVRDGKSFKKVTLSDALKRAGEIARAAELIVAPTATSEAMGVAQQLGMHAAVSTAVPSGTRGTLASIAKSKAIVLVGFDPWVEMPMLALWIHRAVANTAAGPGGANLVVLDEHNGLFRDTQLYRQVQRSALHGALVELVREVEAGTGAGALLLGRPTTLLWGAAVDGDAACRTLLQKLETLLGANGEGGLVGAPGLQVNARAAQQLLARAPLEKAAAVVVGDALSSASSASRVVWLQHGLDQNVQAADVPSNVEVILPLAHPYEQAGSYMSLEGRVQGFDAAGVGPGEAKSDWGMLLLLGKELGVDLPQDLQMLRAHLQSRCVEPFAGLKPNRVRPRAALAVVNHV